MTDENMAKDPTVDGVENEENSTRIDKTDGGNPIYTDKMPQNGGEEDKPCDGNCRPAGPAEAEQKTAANGFGKFKSAEALLKAYTSLEAEFTRRSQRLKELGESKATPSPSKCGKEELLAAAMGDEEVKAAIIADYLETLFSGKSVPITLGGAACAAPRSAPRSVKEAGELANRFLKN